MRSEHQQSVEWCMRAAGQAVRERPEVPEQHELERMRRLMQEELSETVESMGFRYTTPEPDISGKVYRPSLEHVADGLADQIVTIYGTAAGFGIDLDAVLREVLRANKAKFPDGKAILREDGKYLKPEGWKPPDIAGVLRAQGWEG